MSGYRQQGLGPNTADDPPAGPPTVLQRSGIACLFLGALVIFAYLGGRIGLIPRWIDSPIAGTLLVVMGSPLMAAGARRDPLTPEAKRQRMLIIAAAIAVCLLAAAAAFYFKGA